MKKDFKINRLRIKDHFIFNDIDVNFIDKNDKPKQLYTSIIIGPNGTGKSNLLKLIIQLFAELNYLRTTNKRTPRQLGKFQLEFTIDGDKFNFYNYDFDNVSDELSSNKVFLKKNNQYIEFIKAVLPNQFIALSNTITDKFPVEIHELENYTYLGVKMNSNTARTTTFINKTIDLLFEKVHDKSILANLEEALSFLGYNKNLVLTYYPRYKHVFFNNQLTNEKFEDFFNSFWKYTRRDKDSPPWSVNFFKKLIREKPGIVEKLVLLCRKITLNLEYESSRTKYFSFDIFNNILDSDELKLLKILHSLDIISYPSISFYKKESYFSLENTSSGEYHFISGFIGLLAKLTENSLVLIDEPENSLHPNWQMKYITFLKTIFNENSSSHVLIASHSHFMVSDLEPQSSSIVALRKDNELKAALIPSNTYGWSAEEILLNIFKVSSTRNYYLTEKLESIFELISKVPNKEIVFELRQKISELKEIDFSGLSEADPLKEVVETLFKKFEHA
jgi:predicted ATP-dependent endonuclease of OLD family